MINCREEFERWLSEEIGHSIKGDIFSKNKHGCYRSSYVHDAWVPWEASWNRLSELTD